MHLDKMNKEETKKMEEELSPKTLDGHVFPMQFDDEPPEELLFPHFKRGLNGERVMVFADEFADGKIPEDLEFLPGHVMPGKKFTGSEFDAVVYNDPTLNLPYQQWKQLQVPSAADVLAAVTSEAVVPMAIRFGMDEDDEQSTVFSTPKGLVLQTKADTIRITNFGLEVMEKNLLVRDGKEIGFEIGLAIECLGERFHLVLASVDIDSAVKCIQKKNPQCILKNDTKRGMSYVSNFIREKLATCPKRTVYLSPGFTRIGEKWVYVHDGLRSFAPGIMFRCNKSIGRISGVNMQTSFQYAWEVLALTDKLELILPLFLLMHLGVLFNLFRAAGCPPRFVTFLAGTTGSMKTSLALCLFNLFERVVEKPAANFFDTETALEQKLGTAYSQVLLVDDFCPAVTSSNGKQKLSRLETIIRFVGDQISKARSTPHLTLAKEYVPVGCCLVTGESTGGSRSSLLRCLVLPIEKGAVDGKLLAKYQNQPLLLQTHMTHVVEWAGAYGNDIVSFLKQNFLAERQAFAPCVRELRLVDTGAILMLTARTILQYASDIGVFSAEQISSTSAVWRDTLKCALQISESSTKELNPLTMYLTAIMDIRNAGKLPLACGQAAYIASEHVGYIDGDLWWVRPEDIFQRVIKYWKGVDQIFPLRDSEVRKLLAQHKLIEVEHGTRGGQERVSYTKKTTLDGRPRMLVLRADAAKDYLDRELDS